MIDWDKKKKFKIWENKKKGVFGVIVVVVEFGFFLVKNDIKEINMLVD